MSMIIGTESEWSLISLQADGQSSWSIRVTVSDIIWCSQCNNSDNMSRGAECGPSRKAHEF